MYSLFKVLFLLLLASSGYAQQIAGKWIGEIRIQKSPLTIVFNILETPEGLQTEMDSPDQGVTGITASTSYFRGDSLCIEISALGIHYNGRMEGKNHITGEFSQGGQKFILNLSKSESLEKKINRPQEPKRPFPYLEEEVSFVNKVDNIVLKGTLTLPTGRNKHPAVVLISGSGPQNRNEEILNHKPFLVIADYLTRNGIAVLRFDDRGFAESEGIHGNANSSDFSNDAEAAFHFLSIRPEIDPLNIGLIGHSEGGLIAPMIASRNEQVKFIVLLAGTGIRGDQLILLQSELIGRVSGTSENDLAKSKLLAQGAFEIVANATSNTLLKIDLRKYFNGVDSTKAEIPSGLSYAQLVEQYVSTFSSPWMTYFLTYDPKLALEKVKCPVLALNGERDLQVPPKINLEAIELALLRGGNLESKTIEFPNLNHLFQECRTGAPSEYGELEQTIAPFVLEALTNWIHEKIK